MIILTIRTDKPEAELGVYKDGEQLAYEKWEAHRQLAETIHKKIDELLNPIKNSLTSQGISNGTSKPAQHQNMGEAASNQVAERQVFGAGSSNSLKDINGIVCFKGPGSFTGLRIGLSVANALAYGLQIPIVAASGEDWIEQGIKKLQSGHDDKIALPEYGAPPHITKQRK